MDHKFTLQIKEWLEASPTERDYTVGALFLLKLSGNPILYRNLVANIDAAKPHIEYQLQHYYDFRVADLTKAQVAEMSAQVKTIAEELHLEEPSKAADSVKNNAKAKAGMSGSSETGPAAECDGTREPSKMGRREDHDSLPDDIKARFVENLSILQRMRELHLRLRTLSLDNAICPDSERYPFLKELIKLDKQLHSNWEVYDHYVPESGERSVKSGEAKTKGRRRKSTTQSGRQSNRKPKTYNRLMHLNLVCWR